MNSENFTVRSAERAAHMQSRAASRNEAQTFLNSVREKQLEAEAERVRLSELNQRAGQTPELGALLMPDAAKRMNEIRNAVKNQEEILAKALNEAWIAEQKAEKLISRARDTRERTILRLRYLNGMTWTEIAQFFDDIEQPVCERQIFRLHNAALSALAQNNTLSF